MRSKWKAFGWETYEIDGHDEKKIKKAIAKIKFTFAGKPKIIIANTIKGKGVDFAEGHGIWHHRIPNIEELVLIKKKLRLE